MTTDLETEQKEDEKVIKISDFLNEWGDVLKAKVIEGMDPVYNPKSEDDWDHAARKKLENLVRPAFSSQIERGILPVARSLYKEDFKAATLVGEMGAGKSLCGLAIAYLDPKPNKRILIQCPGHLVKKWIREAQQTIPNCACINLNDKSLRSLLAHKGNPSKPKGTQVWVLGKERAKLHFQRKRQVLRRLGNECCPNCGKPTEDTSNSAVCPHCQDRMWSADRNKFRRFAKAEFIKRYLPKGFIDLLVLDEVHELKGGSTAQGQAMSCLTTKAKKIISLTGTLMGGYSRNLYYILWRMFPKMMVQDGFEYRRAMHFAERYGVVERTYDTRDIGESLNMASIGRRIGRSRTKESPGISPLLLPDLLLERSAFMRLSDISDALPEFEEIIIPVNMAEEQEEEYYQLSNDLITATQQALARGDMRLLGKMLQALLAYPDGCRVAEEVTLERDGIEEIVGSAEALDIDTLPKEEHLIKIVQAEKLEGRKTAIFLEHTGTRDLIPTLVEKLQENNLHPLVLRSGQVKPENREEWLKANISTGLYDCLITNPNLVKTGLDLLDFPSIVFFQCGYSVYTLRQASRRSWRIGQDKPVRVFFMAYASTMQDKALALMAEKMETSLAVEGELSDAGLAALSSSENSIVYELARALTGQQITANLTDAWTRYKEKSLVAGLALDDDQHVEETTTTTITTTTTTTSAAGTSSSVTYEYVVRGKVQIKNSGAIVYVDRNRFDLKDGNVFWNGKKVGWYDKKGCGEIAKKPIRIYRPKQSNCYLLAEVREQQAA